MRCTFQCFERHWVLDIQRDGDSYRVLDGATQRSVRAEVIDHCTLIIEVDGRRRQVTFARTDDTVLLAIDGVIYPIRHEQSGSGSLQSTHVVSPEVVAPMPGKVIQVLVQPGDTVASGDTLLILEAMKMENRLQAEGPGTVDSVKVGPGDLVDGGQVLVVIQYEENASES